MSNQALATLTVHYAQPDGYLPPSHISLHCIKEEPKLEPKSQKTPTFIPTHHDHQPKRARPPYHYYLTITYRVR